MKKYLAILAVVAMAATPAMADWIGQSITFGSNTYDIVAKVKVAEHSNTYPYQATILDGQAGMYAAVSTFDTFCVENGTFIEFNPPTNATYWASVDTWAATGKPGNTAYQVVALDAKTAYLYTQWMAGNTIVTGATATDFQNAIWHSQGNVYNSTANEAALYAAAQNAIASSAWSGIGNVRVMNLWYINSPATDIQSVLVMVPAPAALVLGAMGLGLVGWARRRMA